MGRPGSTLFCFRTDQNDAFPLKSDMKRLRRMSRRERSVLGEWAHFSGKQHTNIFIFIFFLKGANLFHTECTSFRPVIQTQEVLKVVSHCNIAEKSCIHLLKFRMCTGWPRRLHTSAVD